MDHVVAQKKQANQRRSPSAGRVKSTANSAAAPKQPAGGGGGFDFWGLFGWGKSSTGPSSPTTDDTAASPPSRNTGRVSQSSESPKPVSSTSSSPEPSASAKQDREVYVDPELDRAAAAIFYAYVHIPRDIPGLNELRLKLIHRWGQDFARKAEEADPSIVEISRDLIERLRLENPSENLIEGYLTEIARSHKIPRHGETWSEGGEAIPSQTAGQSASTEGFGIQGQASKGTVSDADELANRFAALGKR